MEPAPLSAWVKSLSERVKSLSERVKTLSEWVKTLSERVKILSEWVKTLSERVITPERRSGFVFQLDKILQKTGNVLKQVFIFLKDSDLLDR